MSKCLAIYFSTISQWAHNFPIKIKPVNLSFPIWYFCWLPSNNKEALNFYGQTLPLSLSAVLELLFVQNKLVSDKGKSVSEAFILESVNPQLWREIVNWIPRNIKVHNMLCTNIVLNVKTKTHLMQEWGLLKNIYLHCKKSYVF